MIYISHRGNLNGPNKELENSPEYIDAAIEKDFDVEVDFWYDNGQLYLGHDEPQYRIGLKYLWDRYEYLWVHCKDLVALDICLENDIHCFFHDTDDCTLTSRQWMWAYPGKEIRTESCIVVLPERSLYVPAQGHAGICSDYIETIRGLNV